MIARADLFQVIDAVGGWLLATSIRVAAVGLAVFILDRLFARRAWPQLRAALWWLVIAAAVIPPLFDSPLSIWRIADPAVALRDAVNPQPAPTNAELFWRLVRPESALSKSPRSDFALRAAVLLWTLGVVGSAAWLVCSNGRTRRAWLSGIPTRAEPWLECLARHAAQRVGLSRIPPLHIQPNVPGPAVVGCLRPVVVLPSTLVVDADYRHIEHILLHEFAHIRRRDALFARACQLVQVLFWFHPVVRVARQRLDTLREIGCDQVVVAILHEPHAYRRTLLHLARPLVAGAAPATLGFMSPQSQILARLHHLAQPTPNRPRIVRAVTTGLFSLLLLCCVSRGRPTTRPVVDPDQIDWSEVPGCLQLHYYVMRHMPLESDHDHSNP